MTINATIRRYCRVFLVAGALCQATGCYSFVPIEGPAPVGSDVRATLTDEEALRVSRQTGELSRTVDGRLVGATDDSVVVSVVTFRAMSEVSGSRQLRQSVVIPRDGMEHLASRRLSVWRSGVMGVLAASGVALIVNQVVAGGSNQDDDDDGEPIGTFIPILRIPIGR